MAKKPNQPGLFDLPTQPTTDTSSQEGMDASKIEAAGTSSTNPTTVGALTSHIVALFERDQLLKDLWVTGEVSNWKKAASGHVYFSLKESGASISGVMWRRSVSSHSWMPNEGDQIIAHGYVGVYPERGGYQLYVNRIQPAGRGQLYAQFERLKEQLSAAGLFDPERKRAIPSNPKRVGVVTSADAAALRDILRVVIVRWPLLDVILFPTLVQGSDAPRQIVAALESANQYSADKEPLDVILLARGGGSIEDLWSFNDQRVAYAIAESALPVISGVGHETDFTIADFVADLRVPTPSAAAVAVTPDMVEITERFARIRHTMLHHLNTKISAFRETAEERLRRLKRSHPQRMLDLRRQLLDDRTQRLDLAINANLEMARAKQSSAQLRLAALNPHSVLGRGYSIVEKADGSIVKAPEDAVAGETLEIHTREGAYPVERK